MAVYNVNQYTFDLESVNEIFNIKVKNNITNVSFSRSFTVPLVSCSTGTVKISPNVSFIGKFQPHILFLGMCDLLASGHGNTMRRYSLCESASTFEIIIRARVLPVNNAIDDNGYATTYHIGLKRNV